MAKLNVDRYYKILRLFYYDESIISCLRWTLDRSTKTRKNDIAGSRNINGYYYVNIDNKSYLCHIIVFLLHNKIIKENHEVDHYDGQLENNKIGNLREVTPSINSKNRRKRKDNKSGYIGISHRNEKYLGWRARVTINGEVHSKTFYYSQESENNLALENAIKWRINFIDESNKDGAGFTERNTI